MFKEEILITPQAATTLSLTIIISNATSIIGSRTLDSVSVKLIVEEVSGKASSY